MRTPHRETRPARRWPKPPTGCSRPRGARATPCSFGAEPEDNPAGDRYHIHYRPNDPGQLFKIRLPEGPVLEVVASPFEDLVPSDTGTCPSGRKTQTVDLGPVTSFTGVEPDVSVATVDGAETASVRVPRPAPEGAPFEAGGIEEVEA